MTETEPSGIGSEGWWSTPEWLACQTPALRARFVLTELLKRDTQKLRAVTWEIFKAEQVEPADITRDQWQRMLAAMGATPGEVRDILWRLGFGLT
jgi:hypothetical protein